MTVDRDKWKIKDRKGSFCYISKSMLHCDHEHYQRSVLNQQKIRAIAAEWSWAACCAIAVARRPDGRYLILDGQYRWEAAKRRADILDLPCMIFELEDIKAEAQAFLTINEKRKPVNSRDKFKAQLTTENDDALFVDGLIDASRRDTTNSKYGAIRCLSELLVWARKDREALARVYPIVDAVCGQRSIHVHLLQAMMFIETNLNPPGLSSLDRTWRSLSQRPWSERLVSIGVEELLDASRKAAAFRGRGNPKVFAEGVLQRLNRGLRNRIDLYSAAAE